MDAEFDRWEAENRTLQGRLEQQATEHEQEKQELKADLEATRTALAALQNRVDELEGARAEEVPEQEAPLTEEA